jgi:hypothetical protein
VVLGLAWRAGGGGVAGRGGGQAGRLGWAGWVGGRAGDAMRVTVTKAAPATPIRHPTQLVTEDAHLSDNHRCACPSSRSTIVQAYCDPLVCVDNAQQQDCLRGEHGELHIHEKINLSHAVPYTSISDKHAGADCYHSTLQCEVIQGAINYKLGDSPSSER